MDSEVMLQVYPLALIFVVWYALVIRPHRVAENRRYHAVLALSGGEEVVTKDGFIGTVLAVRPARGGMDVAADVALAPGLTVTLSQTAIAAVHGHPAAARGDAA